jgi:hypothetical protein
MPDWEAILRARLSQAERMAAFHQAQYERFKDTPRGADAEAEAAAQWRHEAAVIENILTLGEETD